MTDFVSQMAWLIAILKQYFGMLKQKWFTIFSLHLKSQDFS